MPDAAPPDPRDNPLVLDAVRRAVAEPGDHRLFRAGKLPGLFPARTAAAGDAARAALDAGLLETVRTESKGKVVTEWVRVTPAGVGFVHDRDSPAAVLRELKDVVGTARSGVFGWLADARREVAALADQVERQGAEVVARLDALGDRLDAALHRAEANGPGVSAGVRGVVPWGPAALAYLDKRADAGAAGACSLGELFRAVERLAPGLTVPDFHAGLRRLADARAVRLAPGPADADPEFALLLGAEVFGVAER